MGALLAVDPGLCSAPEEQQAVQQQGEAAEAMDLEPAAPAAGGEEAALEGEEGEGTCACNSIILSCVSRAATDATSTRPTL